MYEFEFTDGSRAERFYPVAEMPRVGTRVRIGRRMATRVLSDMRVKVPNLMHEACGELSSRHGIDPDVPRYSPEGVKGLLGGFPLFENRREIREYEAKKRAKGRALKFDP
jgi:hypothetical protein